MCTDAKQKEPLYEAAPLFAEYSVFLCKKLYFPVFFYWLFWAIFAQNSG
jgi:hypothetical protein